MIKIHVFFKTAALAFALGIMLTGCQSEKDLETRLSLRQIAINAEASGDYDKALEYYDRALKESSYKVTNLEEDICIKKAELFYKMGDLESAINQCNYLIEFNDNYSDAYYLRGLLYLVQDHTETALTDFATAIDKCDKDYETYIAIASALESYGYADEASGYLMDALSFKGEGRKDLTFKGRISYILGDYENAKTLLEAAIAKDAPEGGDKAKLYLGDTYTALGLDDDAQEMYSQYVIDAGDDVDVCLSMGNFAYKKGDYKTALDYYRRGINATDKPKAGLLKGEIAALEQLGKFSEAKKLMKDYVKAYPDDEAAARENLFLKTR